MFSDNAKPDFIPKVKRHPTSFTERECTSFCWTWRLSRGRRCRSKRIHSSYGSKTYFNKINLNKFNQLHVKQIFCKGGGILRSGILKSWKFFKLENEIFTGHKSRFNMKNTFSNILL